MVVPYFSAAATFFLSAAMSHSIQINEQNHTYFVLNAEKETEKTGKKQTRNRKNDQHSRHEYRNTIFFFQYFLALGLGNTKKKKDETKHARCTYEKSAFFFPIAKIRKRNTSASSVRMAIEKKKKNIQGKNGFHFPRDAKKKTCIQ